MRVTYMRNKEWCMHKQRDQNMYTKRLPNEMVESHWRLMHHDEFRLLDIFNRMCSIDFE